MSLNKFVKKASRKSVVDGCRYIKRDYLPQKKLLAITNQLDFNSINAVKNHFKSSMEYNIPQKHIETYLAASSLVHSINGWDYISHAIAALINGDKYSAIHLGYYAELRASMSFLASIGIGIFNRKHIAIFSDGSINQNPKVKKYIWYSNLGKSLYRQVPTTTHQFTWDVLERWVDPDIETENSILNIFTVKGKDFEEWASGFHPNVSNIISSSIVSEWLKTWNFDVKSFREDREKRNEVSYRPQKFNEFDDIVQLTEVIPKLKEFWEALSPLLLDKFNLLDKYLLRNFFIELHSKLEELLRSSIDYENCITDAMDDLGISDRQLFNFLCNRPPFNSDHIIFEEAEKQNTESLSVIARALLMLRVSTGATSLNLKEAEVSHNDIEFYLESLGVENGFWSPNNAPGNLQDLWREIEDYIIELDDWISNNNSDLFNVSQNKAQELIHFSQFNRAGLWGLNL